MFAWQADDSLDVHHVRTGKFDTDDVAARGFTVSIGEAIHEIQRAGLIGRLHADAFSTDRNEYPFEDDETQRGENDHAHRSAPRIAAEDKATKQTIATQ